MSDKWVMVRDYDHQDWDPRILLRDLGAGYQYRYICLSHGGTCAVSFMEMRPATAIELLPCLPGEWAARAMQRAEESPNMPDFVVETLGEAVNYAISWRSTPEGYEAWESLRVALHMGTEIPKCPPIKEESASTVEPAKSMTATSMEMFELELIELINSHCIESVVDMPDFLLARMICSMIEAMGPSIKKTLDWHGCDSVCHPAPRAQ